MNLERQGEEHRKVLYYDSPERESVASISCQSRNAARLKGGYASRLQSRNASRLQSRDAARLESGDTAGEGVR